MSTQQLLETPRTDCPEHLPEAPEPAQPWGPPMFEQHDDDDDDDDAATLGRRLSAQHCSAGEAQCHRHPLLNKKQKKQISLFARLTDKDTPSTEAMTSADADRWLSEPWALWKSMGSPVQ